MAVRVEEGGWEVVDSAGAGEAAEGWAAAAGWAGADAAAAGWEEADAVVGG